MFSGKGAAVPSCTQRCGRTMVAARSCGFRIVGGTGAVFERRGMCLFIKSDANADAVSSLLGIRFPSRRRSCTETAPICNLIRHDGKGGDRDAAFCTGVLFRRFIELTALIERMFERGYRPGTACRVEAWMRERSLCWHY